MGQTLLLSTVDVQIHEWLSVNGSLVELVAFEEEQPVKNMELFRSYASLLAACVEGLS